MCDEDEPKLYAEFNAAKMERFVKRDALLRFVVEDLVKRGTPRAEALKITFNGYVLEDSTMVREYEGS